LRETQTIISVKCVAILFVVDFLRALDRFARRLANAFGRRTTQNQLGFTTERILRAGSLNQAVVGPFPRIIPFLVRLQVTFIVVLESHPSLCQVVDRAIDIVHRKIQDSEAR
jgi:hypothetical protein